MPEIRMDIDGLKEISQHLKEMPEDTREALTAAGKEAAVELINTTGLGKYPPAGPGNSPPTPYYQRGSGTQYADYNAGNSENYGKQFYVNSDVGYVTEIGNRASYAQYLGGNPPAAHMRALGWRGLLEVAEEKIDIITGIYQRWIDKMLKNKGLT